MDTSGLTPGLTHWADILIVVVYFIIVLGIGLMTLCNSRRSNVQRYFLAGRTMPWFAVAQASRHSGYPQSANWDNLNTRPSKWSSNWRSVSRQQIVGASLFSSNIGSEHFVGLAGAGAAAGIALVLFEWFPIFLILMLGWLFIPVYISSGVYTLPEYIERRHGGKRLRMYLSCLALVLYIITKLAAAMFSGALFIQLALKWNMYLSLAVLLVVTGIYTILGGLTAVMYTDTFQTIVMVIGSAVVMITSFVRIGGYQNLERLYFEAIPSVRSNTSSCGLPREDAFHVFQDPVTGDQPWPGLILQSSLGCLWYWCCDQVIVQRSLAARSLSHAKGGSILAGLLKVLPLFLLIFPGMISRILFPDEVACADPEICRRVCDNPVGCSNIAYPKLVLELLPVGARGLLIAVMLSAIMSSLTSIFNSASTVFTMDVWRRIRPAAQQRELLIVGRLFIVIMCVVAILWVPMVKVFQSGRLFNYMTAVEGYIGSPLGVLFLMSIFSTKVTEKNIPERDGKFWFSPELCLPWHKKLVEALKTLATAATGAFYGIILGHVCGVCRFVIELVHPAPPCGEEDTRPSFLSKFHYTYYVQLQLLFTAIAIMIISMFTKARTEEELVGVTWWTKHKGTKDSKEKVIPGEESSVYMMKDISDEVNPTDTSPETTGCKRWIELLCAIRSTNEGTTEEKDHIQDIKSFLRQGKTTVTVLNFAAVLLIIIVVFVTAFYH